MCGITGFCDFQNTSNKGVLEKMTQSLMHRGPDDSGIFFLDHERCKIGLGHTRLSIIDVTDSGHQPMTSPCGNYVIVFNGEIYNYKELKAGLTKDGVSIRTKSDTEVLLALYQRKGLEALQELVGMFAFVILDRVKNQLFCARDRMGIKPFYFYHGTDSFLFGSELKALIKYPGFKKIICPAALSEYFKFGYISEPRTIYQKTRKLKKGHSLVLDLDTNKIYQHPYWCIKNFFAKPKVTASYGDIEKNLIHLLKRATDYRMVADVPVGVFLSGGYDSSLVCSILAKELHVDFETFTLGFEDPEFDESDHASAIAKSLHLKNHQLTCTEEDARKLVEKLPIVFDEPFSDPSAIPTLLISSFAASHVKVILSGDGGDETFGGYNRYLSYHKKISPFHSIRLHHQLKKAVGAGLKKLPLRQSKVAGDLLSGSLVNYMVEAGAHLSNDKLSTLLLDHDLTGYSYNFEGIDLKDQLLLWDYERYLSNNVMVKVDRASMYVGLESREPLLDHNLLEYAAAIPFQFKIHQGNLKYPIKSITHRYIDEKVINRPKRGFSPPIAKWLDGPFLQDYRALTSPEYLKSQHIFDHQVFHSIVEGITPDYLRYRFKWSIYVFQKWYEYWIN